MNSRYFNCSALFAALVVVAAVQAAEVAPAAPANRKKITSDLATPTKRQEVVDKATQLTRPPVPAPLPADLPNPFNPAGFDTPDPEEARPGVVPGVRPNGAAVAPAGPVGDRELLETIAARIQPTGSFVVGGKPLLTFGTKRVRVGDNLEVTLNDRVYEIEVTAIAGSNFTLRYRGEELTRPIAKTTK
jgi:hypothetical protein